MTKIEENVLSANYIDEVEKIAETNGFELVEVTPVSDTNIIYSYVEVYLPVAGWKWQKLVWEDEYYAPEYTADFAYMTEAGAIPGALEEACASEIPFRYRKHFWKVIRIGGTDGGGE